MNSRPIVYSVLVLSSIFSIYTTYFLVEKYTAEPHLVVSPEYNYDQLKLPEYIHAISNAVSFFIKSNPEIPSVISWAITFFVWRNTVRRVFLYYGLDYNIFYLMLRMNGGKTRKRILETLTYPKNRKQIAEELRIDWKAVERHLRKMSGQNLVENIATVGNAAYYVRTEKGTKLLTALKSL